MRRDQAKYFRGDELKSSPGVTAAAKSGVADN
jgi:hypothetical protein